MDTDSVKPRFFSKEGFKHFCTAFKLKDYSPRDWGVWALSSIASDMKYVIGGFLYFLWGLIPVTITGAIKSAGIKLLALFGAIAQVLAV